MLKVLKEDSIAVNRLAQAKPEAEKADLIKDIGIAQTAIMEENKYICAMCEGFGHTYACYRKTKKKKTKLGCPTRDIFNDLIVSKHLTGLVFKEALADRM